MDGAEVTVSVVLEDVVDPQELVTTTEYVSELAAAVV